MTTLDLGWMADALCVGTNPDLFFPGRNAKPKDIKKAKAICAQCPVRVPCLVFAVNGNERWGIFGGTTPRERRAMRQAARFVPAEVAS